MTTIESHPRRAGVTTGRIDQVLKILAGKIRSCPKVPFCLSMDQPTAELDEEESCRLYNIEKCRECWYEYLKNLLKVKP